jgi:YD repeat-containing protein
MSKRMENSLSFRWSRLDEKNALKEFDDWHEALQKAIANKDVILFDDEKTAQWFSSGAWKDAIAQVSDTAGKYIAIERDTQDRLLAFRQQGTEQTIQLVRDENGQIIAAHDERKEALRKMTGESVQFVRDEQGKILSIHNHGHKETLKAAQEHARKQWQRLIAVSDLYQEMFNIKLAMVKGFYQRQYQETERAYDMERAIVVARYENENLARRDIEALDKDYHKRRIDLRKEELVHS